MDLDSIGNASFPDPDIFGPPGSGCINCKILIFGHKKSGSGFGKCLGLDPNSMIMDSQHCRGNFFTDFELSNLFLLHLSKVNTK
jgi:hypothetical protein